MDWEQIIQVCVLGAVAILVLSRTKINKSYLAIALICLVVLWAFFRLMGYD